MKVALSIAVALVILSSIPIKLAHAQDAVNAQASASASANAQAGQSSAGANANSSASADANLRPVQGELVNKLDSKSAKVGDEVVLKTKDKIETAEGTVIPKGSRLVGHVTDVQAHGNGHADSRLSFAFDRADLKGGQSMAIHSVIRTVAPPTSAATAMESDDSMGMGAGPSAGSMAGGGHSMGGGRVGGGLVGGTVNTASAVGANTTSSIDATSGSALRTSTDVAGNTAGRVGGGINGAAGTAGSLSAHATSIPGVMLQSDASAATSGTLSASRRNLHLDAGTQFTLDIAAAATTMR